MRRWIILLRVLWIGVSASPRRILMPTLLDAYDLDG